MSSRWQQQMNVPQLSGLHQRARESATSVTLQTMTSGAPSIAPRSSTTAPRHHPSRTSSEQPIFPSLRTEEDTPRKLSDIHSVEVSSHGPMPSTGHQVPAKRSATDYQSYSSQRSRHSDGYQPYQEQEQAHYQQRDHQVNLPSPPTSAVVSSPGACTLPKREVKQNPQAKASEEDIQELLTGYVHDDLLDDDLIEELKSDQHNADVGGQREHSEPVRQQVRAESEVEEQHHHQLEVQAGGGDVRESSLECNGQVTEVRPSTGMIALYKKLGKIRQMILEVSNELLEHQDFQ